ncbi:MAG: flagellar filament capping protein FliD [Phycisphaerales bacterium]|nr:MAG: flagellar filament capping protein FliD [Phycisphaerales bacterium]
MGELRLPGLATGIDTATLVEQLMKVNSRQLANYQVKKIGYEEETTALNELRTKVNDLNTSVTAISNATSMEAYKASSSDDDVLGVSASEDASEGSHSILIDQLATTETWIQDTSTFDYETDYVGGGTFIYSYNNIERQITAVADETTLEDFADLINNDEENPGVTASLLYQGGKYHLMLSGQRTGEDYRISVNAYSTEVWKADSALTLKSDSSVNASLTTKITELYQFGSNPLEGTERIEITGKDRYDHSIDQLNLPITSNTTVQHILDSIEEAFDGNVKATFKNGEITVTDAASGASLLEVVLTYNAMGSAATLDLPTMEEDTAGAATSESLASLTSTSFIKTQTAQNSEIKVDGYPSGSAVSEVQTMRISAGDPDGGHYHLTYGGHTTGEIAHNAVTATIQAAIDALPNVSSGDIDVTVENTSLDDGEVYFTFSNSMGDVPMILADDSALTGTGGPTIEVEETTEGSTPWISNNSNTIVNAITGITLFLKDVNELDEASQPIPVVITLTRDIGGVTKKVQSMVNAYNTLITFLKEKTEYNTETKEMGLLSRITTISFLKTQLSDPFVGVATGFNDDDLYTEAREIGITLKGDQTLKLDTTVLSDALNSSAGFTAAIELMGAVATGSATSGSVINFYSASSKYTTAGTYEAEVVISNPGSGNVIESARIRQTGGTWHDAEIDGNIITGDSTFDSTGLGPLYPENALQLSVDLSSTGTFTDTVRVKKGFAGELEDMLYDVLRADGRLDVTEEINEDHIERMETKIADEEDRLEKVQDRLIEKFARLEKALTTLNQQMAAVNTVSQITFG